MASTHPVNLRCEYAANPLGIDVAQPRLSWQLSATFGRRGTAQSAYRLRVCRTKAALEQGAADLWDSGEIHSDDTAHVIYEGKALASGERAWWCVQVVDESGEASGWSEAAFWEMGLLERSDWKGEWVGSKVRGGRYTTAPVPLLRKPFKLPSKPSRARLYATALGLYECSLNGQRVGEDHFTPGWTDYDKRIYYQTYDVTKLLNEGENAWGALLGDGWWCGHVEWRGRQRWGQVPRFLGQLEIECADGSTHIIPTDETWRYALGPILESDMLMGESYDARHEIQGWDAPDFDESDWDRVKLFEDIGVPLMAQKGVTVRQQKELVPIRDPWEPVKDGGRRRILFDLGQNMVGWVRLKVKGKAGATVTLRYAEVLEHNTEGLPYYDNLRTAKATDYYTLKGDPAGEVYEPRFTFHGFRYVELYFRGGVDNLETLIEPPSRDTITGIVLHSDTPLTGEFFCSNPLLNQLQSNIEWGQRGNFLEVPTDCPQRDERLGWTGDAQIFIRTAAFNMDVAGFFTKWAEDVADSQGANGQIPPVVPNTGLGLSEGGPGWADACIICPWTLYLCYGDTTILERHWSVFKAYMGFLESTHRDHVRCFPGYDGWAGFGDWLNIDDHTPKEIVGTAFFAYVARLMARIARILDKPSERTHYAELFEKVREAFQRHFLTDSGDVVSKSQTAYILALHFDLVDETKRAQTAAYLVESIRQRKLHLSAGFLGSPYLNHVLTANGHHDLAGELMLQESWPSWLYAVTKGATTIWERWDGWTHDKGFQSDKMNSFNHYAYGAIGAWLYQVVAGLEIDPELPAYKHALVHPRPAAKLTQARASLDTMHGRLSVDWSLREADGTFDCTLSVPPNTTATVTLPAAPEATVSESGKALESAEGIQRIERTNDSALDTAAIRFVAKSGDYRFSVNEAGL